MLGHYATLVNGVAVSGVISDFYDNSSLPIEGALAGVDMVAELICEETHIEEEDDRSN